MQKVVVTEGKAKAPLWIDVVDPTRDELNELAEKYKLHPTLVQDCLEPAHLPKHETHDDTTFLIVRHYDDRCDWKQDSVQAMTRKLALFIGDRFLLSIHRSDSHPFIDKIAKRHCSQPGNKPVYLQVVLLELVMAAVETYHKPLEEMEMRIHGFETSILKKHEALSNWEEVFRTKCRLTVIKRVLWHTMNTVMKFVPHSSKNVPLTQDLRERIENLQFFADSLLDDLNNLLNIQLSLATNKASEASNRTNDVMRVLTIFSVFFLPLNFIVGVYGMNFEHMPELKWKYGYYAVWALLLGVTLAIYGWMTRKRWIRWGHLS